MRGFVTTRFSAAQVRGKIVPYAFGGSARQIVVPMRLQAFDCDGGLYLTGLCETANGTFEFPLTQEEADAIFQRFASIFSSDVDLSASCRAG